MNIRLLAFASASEALGSSDIDFQLRSLQGPSTEDPSVESATVADLKAELTRRHPELEALWERLAVSLNGQIASDAEVITEGAEVALLPPVSGG